MTISLRSLVVLTMVLTGLPALAASEKRIDRSELPAAVQKAVDVAKQGATVRGFSQETDGKETFYEVELVANGRHKDILMDRDGQVVEVEQELPVESLPATVQQRVRAETGDSQIDSVEALTKRGKLAGYEVHVTKDGARTEIQLDPEGQRLKR
jgi:hypothetical protein